MGKLKYFFQSHVVGSVAEFAFRKLPTTSRRIYEGFFTILKPTNMKTPKEILEGKQAFKDFLYKAPDWIREDIIAAMMEYALEQVKNLSLNPVVVGRSEQLKSDLYKFRDMYCQNIDLATIDEYVDGLGF